MIKRYDIDGGYITLDGSGAMESDDGFWCTWDDVNRLVGEVSRLEKELQAIEESNFNNYVELELMEGME